MNQLLIIEDNIELGELFDSILSKHGYQTYLVDNAMDAIDMFNKHYIDLVITDVMMPNMDGFQLIQYIRQFNQDIPILVVTAKANYNDKRIGFSSGADDYMVKPIDVQELVLRVEALLRRAKIANANLLDLGPLKLDLAAYNVKLDQEVVDLPQKEFLLLYKLLSYPNKIFTRQQLMDEIWGLESATEERTVDVHIKRLRGRFEGNPYFEIVTVRGLGYKGVVHIS